MGGYVPPVYPYRRSPDQGADPPAGHQVAVIGAGPVGLTAAIDLASHGLPVVLLDENNTVSVGSRGICHAKRTLEIWDRLGCVDRMMDKGITWRRGKVYFGDCEVFGFDLMPEGGHRFPAFINLQQYYVEQFLVERAAALADLDLRWKNRVVGLAPEGEGVRLEIDTPDGPYALHADWVIAADGVRSTARQRMGLEFRGQGFQDHFLIADVRMQADFPTVRRFWFAPTFHDGGSALIHRQADDVWRIDVQLGPDADPEQEKQPERVIPRLAAMLGPDMAFDIEWASVYTFECRRLEKFRHGRVIFAGDAAHVVSPFGARGGNAGVQDADNLGWKLALVVRGLAPARLLDSYEAERTAAADENILISTRTTDFITPKSKASKMIRDATLALAERHPFARRLVNSGRLSVPTIHARSPLNTPDGDSFAGVVPGAPAADAPIERGGWLLERLRGGFTGLYFAGGAVDGPTAGGLAALAQGPIPIRVTVVGPPGLAPPAGAAAVVDAEGLAGRRYDATPGTFYLFRPDQHVAARWRRFEPARVQAALARASGHIP
ncbi:MAG: FAD-dependent oxidoreductase [Pseudomonadota bacterium]